MTKIIYKSDNNTDNIQECFLPCIPNENEWWRDMLPFKFHSKSLKEWFAKVTLNPQWKPISPGTLKICPGISDLFRQSFVWKMPCDLLLKTYKDGTFQWQTPPCDILRLESHGSEQYTTPKGQTIYKDKFNIKFGTPFWIHSTKPLKMITSPAVYHNIKVDYDVMPGIINLTKNINTQLNLNLMFRKHDTIYEFKKGQVMAYFTVMSDSLPNIIYKPQDESFNKLKLKFVGFYKDEL